MRAQVPVPQGERSREPVQVAGSARSTSPLGRTTVLRPETPGVGEGPWIIVRAISLIPGLSG